MDMENNNYTEEQKQLREKCEPMQDFMDLKPIEVLEKIMEFYTCDTDCENAAAGIPCIPFVDKDDKIYILTCCDVGKKITQDFICFDFTAFVNVVKDPQEVINKVYETAGTLKHMEEHPGATFELSDFTALRFFLAHLVLLPTEEKEKLHESFKKMFSEMEVIIDANQK